MSTYLKNMAGYKLSQLKSKSYDKIQKLFDKEMKRVNTFVDINSEVVKGSETRTEESSKRAGDELESDKSKKQKIDEHVEAEKDDDLEEEEIDHRTYGDVQDEEEIEINAIPLATITPMIVEYKIVKEGQKGFYHLIRADGSSKGYSSMIRMLQGIDREDLETLCKLVKEKHGINRPVDEYERVLWGDMKIQKMNIKFRGGLLGLKDFKIFLELLLLSCCFIEFASLIGSRFDFDRYGLVPRSSPRQADLILTAGTVTMKMAPSLVRLYEQMPEPKYVIAMGACTITGGMFSTDSYSTVRGVDKLIPVDVYLPGCPPKPEAIIDAITKLRKKISREIYPDRILSQRENRCFTTNHKFKVGHTMILVSEVGKEDSNQAELRILTVVWNDTHGAEMEQQLNENTNFLDVTVRIPFQSPVHAYIPEHEDEDSGSDNMPNPTLKNIGFLQCKQEKAVYRKVPNGEFIIVVVNLDDLFVTGASLDLINEFKKRMSSQFEMSDLGELTYYLGIKISQEKDCVEIKQDRYAMKILKEAELTYSVGVVNRYMQSSRESHARAIKQIVCYLKGTTSFGIEYKQGNDMRLVDIAVIMDECLVIVVFEPLITIKEEDASSDVENGGDDGKVVAGTDDEMDAEHPAEKQPAREEDAKKAARTSLILEMKNVFGSYGVEIDYRHFSLIADHMTHSGGYRPMSRFGSISESISPFLKMSFETASKFIVEAASHGMSDNLETPTARIRLGLPVKVDIRSMDLMQKLNL
ncbi:NADH-plastoquinone oxidoreductase subunit K [Tanacetum coccineum]